MDARNVLGLDAHFLDAGEHVPVFIDFHELFVHDPARRIFFVTQQIDNVLGVFYVL
jgi:hypothetical protein